MPIATKPYTCARCERPIREGSQYRRRPEFTGARFSTLRMHPECEEAHIQERVECKNATHS